MQQGLHAVIGDRNKVKALIRIDGITLAVVKNPHTPSEVLAFLATDGINLVRALVATNPSTPPKTLEKFFSDEKIVKDGLSGNPSTPAKLLKLFVNDTDKMVRMRLAENPKAGKPVSTRRCPGLVAISLFRRTEHTDI